MDQVMWQYAGMNGQQLDPGMQQIQAAHAAACGNSLHQVSGSAWQHAWQQHHGVCQQHLQPHGQPQACSFPVGAEQYQLQDRLWSNAMQGFDAGMKQQLLQQQQQQQQEQQQQREQQQQQPQPETQAVAAGRVQQRQEQTSLFQASDPMQKEQHASQRHLQPLLKTKQSHRSLDWNSTNSGRGALDSVHAQEMPARPASAFKSQEVHETEPSLTSGPTEVIGPDGKKVKLVAFDGPNFCKILVPNHIAGALIGKEGTMVGEIELLSKCKMQISGPKSYFPGTLDRVCIIGGPTLAGLTVAVGRIVELLRDISHNPHKNMVVKIVVPMSAASTIIGRKGELIQRMTTETGCRINMSPRVEGFQERLVIVSGETEALNRAVCRILKMVQDDAHLKEHMHITYTQDLPLGSWTGESMEPADANVKLIHPDNASYYTKRDIIEYLIKAAPREMVVRLSLLGSMRNAVKSKGLGELHDALAEVWQLRGGDKLEPHEWDVPTGSPLKSKTNPEGKGLVMPVPVGQQGPAPVGLIPPQPAASSSSSTGVSPVPAAGASIPIGHTSKAPAVAPAAAVVANPKTVAPAIAPATATTGDSKPVAPAAAASVTSNIMAPVAASSAASKAVVPVAAASVASKAAVPASAASVTSKAVTAPATVASQAEAPLAAAGVVSEVVAPVEAASVASKAVAPVAAASAVSKAVVSASVANSASTPAAPVFAAATVASEAVALADTASVASKALAPADSASVASKAVAPIATSAASKAVAPAASVASSSVAPVAAAGVVLEAVAPAAAAKVASEAAASKAAAPASAVSVASEGLGPAAAAGVVSKAVAPAAVASSVTSDQDPTATKSTLECATNAVSAATVSSQAEAQTEAEKTETCSNVEAEVEDVPSTHVKTVVGATPESEPANSPVLVAAPAKIQGSIGSVSLAKAQAHPGSVSPANATTKPTSTVPEAPADTAIEATAVQNAALQAATERTEMLPSAVAAEIAVPCKAAAKAASPPSKPPSPANPAAAIAATAPKSVLQSSCSADTCVEDHAKAARIFSKTNASLPQNPRQPAAATTSTAENERVPSTAAFSTVMASRSAPSVSAVSSSSADMSWAQARAVIAKAAPSFKVGPVPNNTIIRDSPPLTPGVVQVATERADSSSAVSRPLERVDEGGGQSSGVTSVLSMGWRLFNKQGEETPSEDTQLPLPEDPRQPATGARAKKAALSNQDHTNLQALDDANGLQAAPEQSTALLPSQWLGEVSSPLLAMHVDTCSAVGDTLINTCKFVGIQLFEASMASVMSTHHALCTLYSGFTQGDLQTRPTDVEGIRPIAGNHEHSTHRNCRRFYCSFMTMDGQRATPDEASSADS